MRKLYVVIGCVLMVTCCMMCRKANPAALDNDNNFDPRLSGGASTFFDEGGGSLGSPIPGLNERNSFIHGLGDKMFEQPFVAAPAPLYGGLGPVFNNISCSNCHHNDGFGLPTFGELGSSLLMRISIPGTDEHGGPMPAPGFGGQLQNMALLGVRPEARVDLNYTNTDYSFADGETAVMRTPSYTLRDAYIPLPAGYLTSPRLGPPVFGLGLLEAIPEATILAREDPSDKNGDGIRGHANRVYNPFTKQMELGRFGKKANTSTIQLQVGTAFQQDMGLTNYVQAQKSVWGQLQMQFVTDTSRYDIQDSLLDAVTYYIRTLAVPARRNVTDATVKRGELLFTQLNCSGCHVPTVYTGTYVQLAALSNQRIHPYTDMLLHDMGPGLADNRPDYLASGAEWRTPALWGIGMFLKATGRQYYLHDGRAHSVTEAILWHDGEAKRSKDQFTSLPKADRTALLAFLGSL